MCSKLKDIIPNMESSELKQKHIMCCPNFTNWIQSVLEDYIPVSVFKPIGLPVDESIDKSIDTKDKSHKFWNRPYINSNWRLNKGLPNSKFSQHFDARYVKSIDEISMFTILIYLSSHEDGCLHVDGKIIKPVIGRVVIFDQALLHHATVNTDNKYFMRSEILYHREVGIKTAKDDLAMNIYNEAKLLNFTNSNQAEELETTAFKMSPSLENIILDV